MAKRQVPDFDRVVAFDEALARQNPELVARLGGPVAVATIEEEAAPCSDETTAVADTPMKTEPTLKLVGATDATEHRPAKRTGNTTHRRGVVARANGRQLRRLTVYVELGLAQRLRKHCFDHELNLSEVAAEALASGLEILVKRGR